MDANYVLILTFDLDIKWVTLFEIHTPTVKDLQEIFYRGVGFLNGLAC